MSDADKTPTQCEAVQGKDSPCAVQERQRIIGMLLGNLDQMSIEHDALFGGEMISVHASEIVAAEMHRLEQVILAIDHTYGQRALQSLKDRWEWEDVSHE